MKRRTVALLLSLVMAVCCLTGCTSTRVRSYSEESSDASTDKYAAALDAYKSNKKVMTINGSPVYWNEYAYFLCAIMANMERYGMQVSDWSAVYDESSQSTYADLMTESIVNNIAWNHLIEVKAAENDVTFDTAGEQFVQDTVDQTIRNVVGDGGTEAELNEKLQSYYMDLDLYRYFIGRSDQSVNESVMVKRVDQQLRVTRHMIDCQDLDALRNEKRLRAYMLHYLSTMMAVSDIFLLLDGSAEAQAKKTDLWKYLKENTKPDVYRAIRYGFGGITNLNFPKGDAIVVGAYRIAQKIFKFN